MMAVAIDCVSRKAPTGEYSHNGSWAFLRANQLKHIGIEASIIQQKDQEYPDWSIYDTVYLYHTMEFDHESPDALNMFGGPQEPTAKFFERLILDQNKNVNFVSLDRPMPNYGHRCKQRIIGKSETAKIADFWKQLDWDQVQSKCESITDWVLDPGVKFTKPYVGRTKDQWIQQCEGIHHIHSRMIIGDSHTHSAYIPDSIVLRKDGRTLSGILKKGIEKEITDHGFDYNQVKQLTCYWGNIDVRHHICRNSDPIESVKRLLKEYETELLKHSDRGIELELVCLIPIEDESRKLPSTGFFKGTPFYGSRKQRQDVVDAFNNGLQNLTNKHGWNLFSWPEYWYNMDGVEFMETVMERPRSVHLGRKYYRWDLVNDIKNPLHDGPTPLAKHLLSFD